MGEVLAMVEATKDTECTEALLRGCGKLNLAVDSYISSPAAPPDQR